MKEHNEAEDQLRLHSQILQSMDEGVFLIRTSDSIAGYTNTIIA
jgi:hypothetical protein